MKVAILTRVSSGPQATEDRHSLSYQRDLMVEVCQRKGWDVGEVFEIPGESAYKWYPAERPEFQSVIERVRRGEFGALVVYDLTRFARNQAVLHETRRTLRECKTMLWQASGDYDAVADGLRAGVEGAFAEQQSEDQSRKIRAAYERRHRLGLPTGDIPFGYQRGDGPGKPPVVAQDEADAVREAFMAYRTGSGHLAIATRLNAAGFSPRSKRGLDKFTASSVQSLIENKFYAGIVTHKGHEAPGLHEAIITLDEWEATNARTRRHGSHRRKTYGAMLAGLVSCASCGGPVWSRRTGQPRTHYYLEPSRLRARECPAAGKSWLATSPDGVVASVIQGITLGDDWWAYVDWLLKQDDPTVQEQAAREALMKKRDRATNAYVNGAKDEAWWKAELASIDAELAKMPGAASPQLITIGRRLSSMADAWAWWTPKERNEACRHIFADIRLDIPKKDMTLLPREEFRPYFQARQAFSFSLYPSAPDRTRTSLSQLYVSPAALRIQEVA